MLQLTLVQTETSDSLHLSGLLYSPAEIISDIAVIFVHGFTADFYTRPFVGHMAASCVKEGVPLLAIQTRGTGCQSEVVDSTLSKSNYIGSYYEVLEEAYLDIDAWIGYLKGLGYKKFVLVGHSLGTFKAVRYLFEGANRKDILKISLLGPFDKNAFLERKSGTAWLHHLELAKQKIDSGEGKEVIPSAWEDYPMSYQTFYSWYRQSDFNEMWDFYRMKTYNFPIWSKITIPVQVITGTVDEALDYAEFYTREEVYLKMREMIHQSDVRTIEGSGHCFVGHEEEVANFVSGFVSKDS